MSESNMEKKKFIVALVNAIEVSVEGYNDARFKGIKVGQKISQLNFHVGERYFAINQYLTQNCQNRFLTTTVDLYHQVETTSDCVLKFMPTEEGDVFEVTSGWTTWAIEGSVDSVIAEAFKNIKLELP